MSVEKDRQLLNRLGSLGADEASIVIGLKAIHDSCMDGFTNQKVAGRDMLELVEKMPDVARRCLVDIRSIYKDVQARVENATETGETNFVLNLELLEKEAIIDE